MRGSRAERAVVTDWWMTVDRSLLAMIVLLALCGAVAALVATPQAAIHLRLEPFYFAKRHASGIMAALALTVAVSLLTASQVRRLALFLFVSGIVCMALVLAVGIERNGAIRWLSIAGVAIQPSEFLKPGFVVLTAWLLDQSMKRPDMPALELSVVSLGTVLALLVAEPDMGQAIIAASVWCALFFLAGYPVIFAPVLGALAALGLAAAYVSLPHFASRLDHFFAGDGDIHRQTSVAAASFRDAGWLGHGFGEGFIKTRLPDAHNDYVLAAIAEELGIAACLFLILIYALIVGKVLSAAFREPDRFLRLAASGLVMIFGFQALINMAVNLNLLPSKGVTLPFISYGRSSLLSIAITLGMILALLRRGAGIDYNDLPFAQSVAGARR